MKFYALAVDENGQTQVIANLPDVRIEATNEAIRYCRKKGWSFKEVRILNGTEKQNDVLTKTIENKRGRRVFWQF